MSQNIVELPNSYYGQFNQGRPLFNADIFVGEPDTDPEIPINQKQVTLLLENGDEVPVSQPINTGPGGYISHNGSAATMFVEGNYSIKCLNSSGAQEYYFENVFNTPASSGEPASRVDTVADMAATNFSVGEFVDTTAYSSLGPTGANNYEIEAESGQTIDDFLFILLNNGNVARGLFSDGVFSIDQAGADPTAVIDSFTPIQTALNLGIELATSTGVYLTSQSLKWEHGAKLIGKGNWSGTAGKSTWADFGNTVIRYTGTAGGNTAVCILSDAAVGVEPGLVPPSTTLTRDMQNIGLSNIVIDGNLLAGIGVYCVRAFSNNNLDFITVTGTTAHAFLAMTCFNGSIKNWMAVQNSGKGITLGQNIFGWSNAVVDQNHFDSFFGYFSGYNNGYLNQFDEVTNPIAEYGIGWFGGRGTVFTNCQANNCGGMGIYLNPQNSPTTFNGGYVERNGESSGSTQSWDIWFFGKADASSFDVTFDSMHIGSPGKTPNIRLTGTAPSREEAGLVFKRMNFIENIDSDWDNYRLIDCNRSVVYTDVVAATATPPSGFVSSINGSLNNNVCGVATFDPSGGNISTLATDGIISGVNYIAVGIYEVTLSTTFPSARYGIFPASGNNKTIGSDLKTGNSFRLNNRDSTGTLSDTASGSGIHVMVTSFFT